jgi:hypothetical protein
MTNMERRHSERRSGLSAIVMNVPMNGQMKPRRQYHLQNSEFPYEVDENPTRLPQGATRCASPLGEVEKQKQGTDTEPKTRRYSHGPSARPVGVEQTQGWAGGRERSNTFSHTDPIARRHGVRGSFRGVHGVHGDGTTGVARDPGHVSPRVSASVRCPKGHAGKMERRLSVTGSRASIENSHYTSKLIMNRKMERRLSVSESRASIDTGHYSSKQVMNRRNSSNWDVSFALLKLYSPFFMCFGDGDVGN